MVYWYVLFVKTGKEHRTENYIREWDKENLLMPFIPILETYFKKRGIVKKETELLFPGYLFVETELEPLGFLNIIRPLIYRNDDIIKVLSYDSCDIALREEERRDLLRLCDDNNTIEASVGFIVGDKIYVTEGALAGRESIIKKIDRHKMEAVIELNFMGCVRQVKMALRVLEKI